MAQNPTANDVKRDADAATTEAKRDLREGAERIADEARETARNLADNDAAQRLGERGAAIANNAVEAGREYADRARVEAERLYEAGQQRAQDVAHYAEERYDEVSEMVRRNPAQALGIAAGIGFLVGLLVSRR
jgi:ElaB/YqjD/DUF883 family membrane-anchored ribosome-binding protein